nr:histidine kinase dimerization/phosphoacceptor domain-containing protein [Streptomyces lydicus]
MNGPETDGNPVMIGAAPRTRRQAFVKAGWIVIWFLYLAGPIGTLAEGGMSPAREALGWGGLLTFVGVYFVLVFRHMAHRPVPSGVIRAAVVLLAALAALLAWTLGPDWLVLFTFVCVAVAVTQPFGTSRWAIPALTAALVLIGMRFRDVRIYLFAYALPCLLSGFAMVGVQHLIRTTQELRAARQEVARLAANEERLRLARDLHDLLGHSLSLITLKSELAGRMLPDKPAEAAQQVADIEQVSRQALVDVREAVTGYRRPRLVVELAGVRAALRTAAITADIDPRWNGSTRASGRTGRARWPGRCGRRSPTSYGTVPPAAASCCSPRSGRPTSAATCACPSSTTAPGRRAAAATTATAWAACGNAWPWPTAGWRPAPHRTAAASPCAPTSRCAPRPPPRPRRQPRTPRPSRCRARRSPA